MEPTWLEQREEPLDRAGTEVDPVARLRADHRHALHCVDPLQPMVGDAARASRLNRAPCGQSRGTGFADRPRAAPRAPAARDAARWRCGGCTRTTARIRAAPVRVR